MLPVVTKKTGREAVEIEATAIVMDRAAATIKEVDTTAVEGNHLVVVINVATAAIGAAAEAEEEAEGLAVAATNLAVAATNVVTDSKQGSRRTFRHKKILKKNELTETDACFHFLAVGLI